MVDSKKNKNPATVTKQGAETCDCEDVCDCGAAERNLQHQQGIAANIP